MWWEVAIGCLLFYIVWLAGYTLYEKSRPKRRGASLKNYSKELTTEQILGKSKFKVCHSMPQVSTYPKSVNGKENDSIFANENKKKPSADPSEGELEEEFSEQPNIDLVPLEYQTEEKVTLNLGEEEEVYSLSVEGKAEYAGGVDLEQMMKALATVNREDATSEERQQAAEVLDRIRKTKIMEQLREEPKRARKIDELINERFAELSQTMPQGDESDKESNEGVGGFNINDYLPS